MEKNKEEDNKYGRMVLFMRGPLKKIKHMGSVDRLRIMETIMKASLTKDADMASEYNSLRRNNIRANGLMTYSMELATI